MKWTLKEGVRELFLHILAAVFALGIVGLAFTMMILLMRLVLRMSH